MSGAKWLILVGITALQISVSKSQDSKEKKPQSVKDILNTTSCIPPPYRCPHHKMQFYLYTRTTQEKGELINTLDDNSLTRSKFNTNHETKIVVHGFGGGRNLSPSTDMRKAYFTRGNYNIIIVDYGSLVKEPCLSQKGNTYMTKPSLECDTVSMVCTDSTTATGAQTMMATTAAPPTPAASATPAPPPLSARARRYAARSGAADISSTRDTTAAASAHD